MNPDTEPRLVTDPALAGVLEDLIRREPIFHRPELGTTHQDFENMLATDFWEVGASGRRYSRKYALDVVEKRHERPEPEEWEAAEFHCQELSPGLYLLTYTLLQNRSRRTRRSTIWKHTPTGWQVVFHQGTIVEGA